MYITKNGWTKASMIEHIKTNFKGWAGTKFDHGTTICYYRTPALDSKGCAVGIFIPDSMYRKEMEGRPVEDLEREFPDIAAFMPLERFGMHRLQHEHDTNPDNTLAVIVEFVEHNVVDIKQEAA